MTQCTEIPQVPSSERTEHSSLFKVVHGWMCLQIRKRRNRKQLMRLAQWPEYLLRDIGLDRYEVIQEANRPFWH